MSKSHFFPEEDSPKHREQLQRRQSILALIHTRPIHDQRELGQALKLQGLRATQSTLSRDLQALGIRRVHDPREGWRYLSRPTTPLPSLDSALREALRLRLVAVHVSESLVVCQAQPRQAMALHETFATLPLPLVIGLFPGPTQVLLVASSKEGAQTLSNWLNHILTGDPS